MKTYVWILQECEHCDGDRQQHLRGGDGRWRSLGREDFLRGFVCQECDDSLDELLEERRKERATKKP